MKRPPLALCIDLLLMGSLALTACAPSEGSAPPQADATGDLSAQGDALVQGTDDTGRNAERPLPPFSDLPCPIGHAEDEAGACIRSASRAAPISSSTPDGPL